MEGPSASDKGGGLGLGHGLIGKVPETETPSERIRTARAATQGFEDAKRKLGLGRIDSDVMKRASESEEVGDVVDCGVRDSSQDGGKSAESASSPVADLTSIAVTVKTKRRAASKNVLQFLKRDAKKKQESGPIESSSGMVLDITPEILEHQGQEKESQEVGSVEVTSEFHKGIVELPDEEDKCCNCLKTLTETDKNSEIRLSRENVVTVQDVLCTTLRIPKVLKEDLSNKMLCLCDTCCQTLSNVYDSLLKFLAMSSELSYVRRLIHETEVLNSKCRKRRKGFITAEVQVSCDEDSEEEEADINDDDEDFHASDKSDSSFSSSEDDSYTPRVKKALHDSTLKEREDLNRIEDTDNLEDNACPRPLRPQRSRKNRERLKYICSQCEKEFFQARELRRHVRSEHKMQKPQSCVRCSLEFTSANGLLEHIKSSEECRRDHFDRQRQNIQAQNMQDCFPYKCQFCNSSFRRADELQVHFRHDHNSRAISASDDEANAVSSTEVDVIDSRSSLVLSCEYCAKGFLRRDQLETHRRVHTGEKPVECKICDKRFADRRGLAFHELIHSDDRPYCCPFCGITFKRLHHLTDHEKTHNPEAERPFTCIKCLKSFKLKKHLNAHLLSHGDSKINCDICSKGFSRKDNLLQHVRKVHGNGKVEKASTDAHSTTLESSRDMVATAPVEMPLMETINLEHVVYISL